MKILLLGLLCCCFQPARSQKLKVVISSDFPPVDVLPGSLGQGPLDKRSDPDDIQSMVRFLLYANEFDVQALVAASGTLANVANKQPMLDMLGIYDQVDENLRKHDPSYPLAGELKKVVVEGYSGTYGKPAQVILGEGKDSEASDYISALLTQGTQEPIWFCFWGGTQELAQALWRIKQTHPIDEVRRIVSKVRVYMIDQQDGSGQWLMDTFPDMLIILNKTSFKSFFYHAEGSNQRLGNLYWLNEHIRKRHGALGEVYPESGWLHQNKGVIEGDTPSFLYLLSQATGLSDPEKPGYGSWGGRFMRASPQANHWIDAGEAGKSILLWQSAYQRDFAARMDRCLGSVKQVNHNPVARITSANGPGVALLKGVPGSLIRLDASASSDPDGDSLHYRWFYYPEAGTYKGKVEWQGAGPVRMFRVPKDVGDETIHLLVEVSDNGQPPLVGYKRIVVTKE